MSEPAARLPVAALAERTGFRAGARFMARAEDVPDIPATPEEAPDAPDPLAVAYADGFATGAAEARATAEEQARVDEQAREKLSLSFEKFDRQMEEDLRLHLREVISALCEATLAPLALDSEALVRRIEAAVSMLARAEDERLIRLHPDDIAMLSDRMNENWQIEPDPALERGALRVESTMGGVEDGPATWRAMIEEALQRC